MIACEIPEKLRVVILYDRLDSVGKAMAAYAHLTRELEYECQPELSIWRLDVATSPEFAVKADYDIAVAQIVLMAVRGSEPCPPAFRHWQERAWSDEGAPQRVWITVVVAPDEPAPAAETWATTLRSAATQIHPEIFVWEPREEFDEAAPQPDADELEPVRAVATLASEVDDADEFHPGSVSAEPGLVAAYRD